MIRMGSGLLLDSKDRILVNTVNCQGVMGKGLALAFKLKFPQMFVQYRKACQDGLLKPGKPFIYPMGEQVLYNFVTKVEWRNPSQIEWIDEGLKQLRLFCDTIQPTHGPSTIAMPPLGCGNGGLKWEQVKPLIDKYFKDCPHTVTIYFYRRPDDSPSVHPEVL